MASSNKFLCDDSSARWSKASALLPSTLLTLFSSSEALYGHEDTIS